MDKIEELIEYSSEQHIINRIIEANTFFPFYWIQDKSRILDYVVKAYLKNQLSEKGKTILIYYFEVFTNATIINNPFSSRQELSKSANMFKKCKENKDIEALLKFLL